MKDHFSAFAAEQCCETSALRLKSRSKNELADTDSYQVFL